MDREKQIPVAAELGLARLKELKNFEVLDGDHDIRGWKVRAPEGTVVGKVDELIVDQAERKVRYVEIELDRKALNIDDNRHVLVPIEAVTLNAEKKDVMLERLPLKGLAGVPADERGPIAEGQEVVVRKPLTNDEIVIRKNTTGEAEKRD